MTVRLSIFAIGVRDEACQQFMQGLRHKAAANRQTPNCSPHSHHSHRPPHPPT